MEIKKTIYQVEMEWIEGEFLCDILRRGVKDLKLTDLQGNSRAQIATAELFIRLHEGETDGND